MTTTARIVAKTAAEDYTASVAAGVVANFNATNLIQAKSEEIQVLVSNAAGVYGPLTYIDGGGKQRNAMLTATNSSILLQGPLDFRFSKPETENLVELSEFS
jgi:hypothetical protein